MSLNSNNTNNELPFDLEAYKVQLEKLTPAEIQRYTTELLIAEDRIESQITDELQTRTAALGELSEDTEGGLE